MDVQHRLDATGLFCPEPLMLLHGVMRKAQSQDIIYVQATDPSTQRDITKFCVFLGHQLLDARCEGDVLQFWIQKK